MFFFYLIHFFSYSNLPTLLIHFSLDMFLLPPFNLTSPSPSSFLYLVFFYFFFLLGFLVLFIRYFLLSFSIRFPSPFASLSSSLISEFFSFLLPVFIASFSYHSPFPFYSLPYSCCSPSLCPQFSYFRLGISVLWLLSSKFPSSPFLHFPCGLLISILYRFIPFPHPPFLQLSPYSRVSLPFCFFLSLFLCRSFVYTLVFFFVLLFIFSYYCYTCCVCYYY